MDVLDQNVGGVRRDDDLHRLIKVHLARHAGRQARIGRIDALSAGVLVPEVGLENGLIFRRQRRALLEPRLARIEFDRTDLEPAPLAPQVGIARFIVRLRGGAGGEQRERQRDGGDRASVKHASPSSVAGCARRSRRAFGTVAKRM